MDRQVRHGKAGYGRVRNGGSGLVGQARSGASPIGSIRCGWAGMVSCRRAGSVSVWCGTAGMVRYGWVGFGPSRGGICLGA